MRYLDLPSTKTDPQDKPTSKNKKTSIIVNSDWINLNYIDYLCVVTESTQTKIAASR